MKPTIYLSNWSSSRKPGHHGPGRKLTIMAVPRAWEHGDGRVPGLMPARRDLLAMKAGEITVAEYRARYVARLGSLVTVADLYTTAGGGTPVSDGDTLCCACSREAAAKGECHRVWAAEALVKAGWRVVLDGVEVAS